MLSVALNDRLNELLIELSRSLVQYTGECWPWSSSHSSEAQETISQIVAVQKVHIAQLYDVLRSRHHRIDPGTYPTEYTSLHYVSLDYLLGQLVTSQAAIVSEVNVAISECAGDPQVAELLRRIQSSEQQHLEQLRRLEKTVSSAA